MPFVLVLQYYIFFNQTVGRNKKERKKSTQDLYNYLFNNNNNLPVLKLYTLLFLFPFKDVKRQIENIGRLKTTKMQIKELRNKVRTTNQLNTPRLNKDFQNK